MDRLKLCLSGYTYEHILLLPTTRNRNDRSREKIKTRFVVIRKKKTCQSASFSSFSSSSALGSVYVCIQSANPDRPFAILEPRNSWIDVLELLQQIVDRRKGSVGRIRFGYFGPIGSDIFSVCLCDKYIHAYVEYL